MSLKFFATLPKRLHRQAQEAFGRSLKVENPTLYQLTEKLYRTRNKIVYEGVIPKKDEFFQIDSIEARMTGSQICPALICACDVFAWLGEKDDYMPPRGGQVVQSSCRSTSSGEGIPNANSSHLLLSIYI